MRKWIDWIRQHQIAAFYILVFGLSWPSIALAFWAFPDNLPLQAIFGKLWAFGPALVALLISAIVNPEPKRGSGGLRWIVFAAGWLFSWLILVLNARLVLSKTTEMGLVVALGICALLPAWILSSVYSKTPGIRRQFSTLLKPRGSILWYVVALFSFPVLLLAGAGITRLLGGVVAFRDMGFGSAVALPLIHFLEGFLASGGVNEESGWRASRLPSQKRAQTRGLSLLWLEKAVMAI